jgi:hypothetical protein
MGGVNYASAGRELPPMRFSQPRRAFDGELALDFLSVGGSHE